MPLKSEDPQAFWHSAYRVARFMAVPDMKQPSDACGLVQPWYESYDAGYGVEVYQQDYEVDEDPKPRRRGGRRRKKMQSGGSSGDLTASPVKAQRLERGLFWSSGGPARGLLAAFGGRHGGLAAGGERGAGFLKRF